MQNDMCTKKYPRELIKETVHSDKGYPLYRRRPPAVVGKQVDIRTRSGEIKSFDNSWAVTYSPILWKLYNAHINVEACNSVRAIKYICKSSMSTKETTRRSSICVMKVLYRHSIKYKLIKQEDMLIVMKQHDGCLVFHYMKDIPLLHILVDLENGQRVLFDENTFQDKILSPPKTTMTAFFHLCQNDTFANTPVENQPGVKASDALGRVYTVHVTNLECLCLRMLLHHVRGPSRFTELKIVNGQECQTYREACEARRWLENDNHWDKTMEEAVQC
ncbi:hypothetical protein TNCV_1331261 [Trichonephila clavipes]|nr:hypothetical protein TNCV_1331261 [Trichonephila clavipes]